MSSGHQIQLLHVAFFLLVLAARLSASALISDAEVGNGRRLLQIKKPCPVNIENQNYTIITSQCKGPDYPPEPCCSGLKELACPFAEELSDLSNDCSDKLFSYISTVGQYPAGLFASICREGKEGISCPVPPPSPPSNAATPIVLRSQIFFGMQLFTLLFLLPQLEAQFFPWILLCFSRSNIRSHLQLQ